MNTRSSLCDPVAGTAQIVKGLGGIPDRIISSVVRCAPADDLGRRSSRIAAAQNRAGVESRDPSTTETDRRCTSITPSPIFSPLIASTKLQPHRWRGSHVRLHRRSVAGCSRPLSRLIGPLPEQAPCSPRRRTLIRASRYWALSLLLRRRCSLLSPSEPLFRCETPQREEVEPPRTTGTARESDWVSSDMEASFWNVVQLLFESKGCSLTRNKIKLYFCFNFLLLHLFLRSICQGRRDLDASEGHLVAPRPERLHGQRPHPLCPAIWLCALLPAESTAGSFRLVNCLCNVTQGARTGHLITASACRRAKGRSHPMPSFLAEAQDGQTVRRHHLLPRRHFAQGVGCTQGEETVQQDRT